MEAMEAMEALEVSGEALLSQDISENKDT